MAALVLVSIGGGEYLASLVNTMLWDQIVALKKEQATRLTDTFNPVVAFLVSDDYTHEDRPKGCPMRHGCVLRSWLSIEGDIRVDDLGGGYAIFGLLIVKVG